VLVYISLFILIIKTRLGQPLFLWSHLFLIGSSILIHNRKSQRKIIFSICVKVALVVFNLCAQLIFLPFIDIVTLTAIRVQFNIIRYFHPRLRYFLSTILSHFKLVGVQEVGCHLSLPFQKLLFKGIVLVYSWAVSLGNNSDLFLAVLIIHDLRESLSCPSPLWSLSLHIFPLRSYVGLARQGPVLRLLLNTVGTGNKLLSSRLCLTYCRLWHCCCRLVAIIYHFTRHTVLTAPFLLFIDLASAVDIFIREPISILALE